MGEKLVEAGPVVDTDNNAAVDSNVNNDNNTAADDFNTNNDLAMVVAIPPTTTLTRKKRSKSFSLLKVAMTMFRKPEEKSKNSKPPNIKVDVASKGDWKKIVGSMRPLHLQDNQSPMASPLQSYGANDDYYHHSAGEQFDDVMIAPPSPALSCASTSTSTGTMSQYASANNLQELDRQAGSGSDFESEYADDEGQVFDDKAGDEMIDAKAEEFIALFYAQMRRQHLDWDYQYRGNRDL